MRDERLAQVLSAGSTADCVAFFRGMPERRRRELAPQCAAWAKDVKANRIVSDGDVTFRVNSRLDTAVAAVYCTGSLTELKKAPWRWFHDHDAIYEILADRRPDWLEAWSAMILDDAHYWVRWRPVRRLVRAGLVKKPEHPHYYLGMIFGVKSRFDREGSLRDALLADPELLDDEFWRLFEFDGGGENSLAVADHSDDPNGWTGVLVGLMQEGRLERTRLFDHALAALARDFNHYRARWFATFYDALQPTADETAEHAERLLDLLRVSAPNIVSWAFDKVVQLARQGLYSVERLAEGVAPVLRAKAKGTVKQALQLLATAADRRPEYAERLGVAAAEALGHENAEVQAAAVKLVESLGVASRPAVRTVLKKYSAGAAASTKKLLAKLTEEGASGRTSSSSVQSEPAVTKSGEKQPASKSTTAKGTAAAPAASSTPVDALFAVDRLLERRAAGEPVIPAAVFDGTDVPRLTGLARQAPIQTVDELIELCSRVVEDETLVDDAERCYDGLSRLCADKPADFERRTAPLLKRVHKLLHSKAPPFVGIGPWDDLCGLIYAWTTGKVVRPKGSGRTVKLYGLDEVEECFGANLQKALGFLARRSQAIAERLAVGRAAPLLSAPTHAGGWIDPQELVRRTIDWTGEAPDEWDVILALLRLAPDGRAAALQALRASGAGKTDEEWRRAVRYALGGDSPIGERASWWVAAARARTPWSTDAAIEAKFPGLGPDAGVAADYDFRIKIDRYKFARLTLDSIPPAPKTADPTLPTVVLHSQRSQGRDFTFELGGAGGKTVGSVRWSATIWPVARESYFAAGWEDLADNVDWSEANWQFRTYLEPLLDSGAPLRAMGLMLLATGLAAKEPGEQGLAVDAAVRAIEDGRLGSDNLGRAIERLLPTGLIKPGRWQKSLSEVARVSAVHAATVQFALQQGLRGDPKKLPKDFSKLLELLSELSHELGLAVQDEGCRAWLKSLGKAGKPGKLAVELLSLPVESSSARVGELLDGAVALRRAAAAART